MRAHDCILLSSMDRDHGSPCIFSSGSRTYSPVRLGSVCSDIAGRVPRTFQGLLQKRIQWRSLIQANQIVIRPAIKEWNKNNSRTGIFHSCRFQGKRVDPGGSGMFCSLDGSARRSPDALNNIFFVKTKLDPGPLSAHNSVANAENQWLQETRCPPQWPDTCLQVQLVNLFPVGSLYHIKMFGRRQKNAVLRN